MCRHMKALFIGACCCTPIRCSWLPTLAMMFAADLQAGCSIPTLCLQHAPARTLIVPQQRHHSTVHPTAKRLQTADSTRHMAARAQLQETLTSDGPSVPEILQSKGRRIRVNYIRMSDDYEVLFCIQSPALSLDCKCPTGSCWACRGGACMCGRMSGRRPTGAAHCRSKGGCYHDLACTYYEYCYEPLTADQSSPCMTYDCCMAAMHRLATTSRWTWCLIRRKSISTTG